MNFDKAKWWVSLEQAEPKWESSMASTLARMLETTEMQAALRDIYSMFLGDTGAMRGIDFTTQEGVAAAIKLQGRTQGLLDSLQDLADKAEEGNDDG